MGKGRRNRERNLQEQLETPAAKNLKTKKKSGVPSWLPSVVAILVVIVILLPLIISGIQESGFFPRHRILIESQSGEFDINQQMATFLAWETMYQSGLQYYQLVQYGMTDELGASSYSSAYDFAQVYARFNCQEYLRDSVEGIIDPLKQYVAVCDLAHKEGISLTEEDMAQVDEVIAWLNDMRANTAFTSLDKFLNYTIGTGIKEKDVRAATEMVVLYNKYAEKKQLELDSAIDLEQLINYREENPETFYKIDYLSHAVKTEELANALKDCKTPHEFNDMIIKIMVDDNYKAIYNKYTTQTLVSDYLKNVLGDKTDKGEEEGNALSDAWATIDSNVVVEEFTKDQEGLDKDLSAWLFDAKRVAFNSGTVATENGIYLVSFYSKNESGSVSARVKFFEFGTGDDLYSVMLEELQNKYNPDPKTDEDSEDEKKDHGYKSAATKAEELQKEANKEGADVVALLKDYSQKTNNSYEEYTGIKKDDTGVPEIILKNVFAKDVKANTTFLVPVEKENITYVVYVRALTEATEDVAATADISFVKTETDTFCLIFDELVEIIDDEDFVADAKTAAFQKEPTEDHWKFLFELKEGEGFVSARAEGDTYVATTEKEDTATQQKTTTYTVYMAVANTDHVAEGEMLYIEKDMIVTGGYLLFVSESAAKAAMEQLNGKTGDELSEAFAALTSDVSTNKPSVSESNTRDAIDKVQAAMGEWMFDAARKDGDLTIVPKTDSKGEVSGYYLTFYVESAESWNKTARSSLLNERFQDWLAELIAPYTVNEKALKKLGEPAPEATEEATA